MSSPRFSPASRMIFGSRLVLVSISFARKLTLYGGSKPCSLARRIQISATSEAQRTATGAGVFPVDFFRPDFLAVVGRGFRPPNAALMSLMSILTVDPQLGSGARA